MKKLLLAFLLLLPGLAQAQYSLVNCSNGPVTPCTTSGPSATGNGDQLWLAMGKLNNNFLSLPLPANIALLNGTQTFTGVNTFSNTLNGPGSFSLTSSSAFFGQPVTVGTPGAQHPMTVNGAFAITTDTSPQLVVSAPTAGQNSELTAVGGQASTLSVMGNGNTVGNALIVQQSGTSTGRVKNVAGPLLLGSGTQDAISIATTGTVTVNTPTSGAALTVSGFQTSGVAVLTSGNTGANQVADLSVTRNGSTINAIGKGPNIQLTDLSTAQNASLMQNSGGQTELYQNNSSTWTRFAHTDTSDNFYMDVGFGNAGTIPFLGVTVGPGTHFLCYNSSNHQISVESTVACNNVTSPPNYSAGTFVGTFTDGTNTVQANVSYVIVGVMAVVTFPSTAHITTPTGTSFQMTGLPANLQPASLSPLVPIASLAMENNGSTINSASVQVGTGSSTLTFGDITGSGGWSGAGARGFAQTSTTTWTLQ